MESSAKEYVFRNCLTHAYDALRSKERFVGETTTSPYETFFKELGDALAGAGGSKKLDTNVSNSEVESFYQGRVSPGEFRLHCQKRFVSCLIQTCSCPVHFAIDLADQLISGVRTCHVHAALSYSL